MNKPIRYSNSQQKKLDHLFFCHAAAIQTSNKARAEALMVEIDALRAKVAANKARAAASAEARRQAGREKWLQEQMEIAAAAEAQRQASRSK